MKRLYTVLSLVLVLAVFAFPGLALAADDATPPPAGWTWDETSPPAADGWTWDEV
jgi:hypothetical protein